MYIGLNLGNDLFIHSVKPKHPLKFNINSGVSNKRIVIKNQTPTSNNPVLNILFGQTWCKDKAQIKIEGGVSILPYTQKKHTKSRDVASIKFGLGYKFRPHWVISGILGYKFHSIQELNISDENDQESLGLQDQNDNDIKQDTANICAGLELQYTLNNSTLLTGGLQYAFPFSAITGLFRLKTKTGEKLREDNGLHAMPMISNSLSFIRFTFGVVFDVKRQQ
ncbi:MAG: hypothetical protein H6850_03060 [Alphaproteobacteria bacterium]|nr:MAG: hypothetical protein H6850_03060 [Alphaproteobacteria bacterium]